MLLKVAIIQENHLAKIVIIYILDIGSRNQKQNLFYILCYLLKIIIKFWRFERKKKNSLKSAKFWPFLSFENLWIVQKNHIFQVKTLRKFTSRRERWSPRRSIGWTNTMLVLDFILFYFIFPTNCQKASVKLNPWHPHCKTKVMIRYNSSKPNAAKWQHTILKP
jgi:hypothetical protein